MGIILKLKVSKYIPFYILLFAAFNLTSQNSAYFKFDGLDTLDKRSSAGFPPAYHYIEFKINGTQLAKKDSLYKIKTNKELDTIYIKNGGYENNRDYFILTKLHANKKYEIIPDACSLYEIIPNGAKKELVDGELYYIGGGGYIRFIIKNRTLDSLITSSPFFFSDLKELNGKDTTNYFCVAHSGYCPFASTGLGIYKIKGIITGKEILEDSLTKNKDYYSTVCFQFFEEEKYSLTYDCKTNSIKAKFDGYFNRKTEYVKSNKESPCILLRK